MTRVAGLAPYAVIAHRGASAALPENTLPSFEAAARAGADMVELDVRLTADGTPVAMHDADVARTTCGSGAVRELSLEEVRSLRVRGAPTADVRVPTLVEVLALLHGQTAVEIEIKEPGHRDAVDAVLAALAAARFDAVLITAFDPGPLELVRRAAPGVATGLEIEGDRAVRSGLDRAAAGGHAFLLTDAAAMLRAGPPFLARAHRLGIRVAVWTVDDVETLEELFTWGVDAVETNVPETAVPVRNAARMMHALVAARSRRAP